MNQLGVPEWAVFEEQMRDLLPHVHELTFVEQNALAQQLLTLLPASTDTASLRIRTFLFELIEQLKPEPHLPDDAPQWRQYTILRERYVMQRPLWEIEARLALGERQLRREHQRAVGSLAVLARSALAEHVSIRSTEALTPPVQLDMPTSDAMALEAAVQRLSPAPRSFGMGELLREVAEVSEHALRITAPGNQAQLVWRVTPPDMTVFTDRGILHQLLLKLVQYCAQFGTGQRDIALLGELDEPASVQHLRLQINGQVDAFAPLDHDLLKLCRWLADLLQSELVITLDQSVLTAQLHLPTGTRLRRVLIVDDEPPAIELFRSYLTGLSFEVAAETSSEMALQSALEFQPEVIVLDVMMPAMDGWEVLQRLRHSAPLRDIPIIACSVLHDAELARALGATQFLHKPILRQQFIRALEAVLG